MVTTVTYGLCSVKNIMSSRMYFWWCSPTCHTSKPFRSDRSGLGQDAGTPTRPEGVSASPSALCADAVGGRGRDLHTTVTQLAVTFDHRLIDGDRGSTMLALIGGC